MSPHYFLVYIQKDLHKITKVKWNC